MEHSDFTRGSEFLQFESVQEVSQTIIGMYIEIRNFHQVDLT